MWQNTIRKRVSVRFAYAGIFFKMENNFIHNAAIMCWNFEKPKNVMDGCGNLYSTQHYDDVVICDDGAYVRNIAVKFKPNTSFCMINYWDSAVSNIKYASSREYWYIGGVHILYFI